MLALTLLLVLNANLDKPGQSEPISSYLLMGSWIAQALKSLPLKKGLYYDAQEMGCSLDNNKSWLSLGTGAHNSEALQ